MTATDRIKAAILQRLEEHRSVFDSASDLNSVTILIQLNRHGPGRDKVLVRTESGHGTNGGK